jgi:predicted dienelactone hydrolase
MNRIALLFLGAAWFASSIAHVAEACRLPEPSGPYGIGRVAYDWTDNSRSDTLGADPKRNRELMVYLWYPIERAAGEPHGVYMPGAKFIDADPELGRQMREGYGEVWPQIVSGVIYSHAVENAPVARSPKHFPVVVFSHGVGGSNVGYTSLFEALVSRGYVAAIQHPGTADVVVLSQWPASPILP